MNYRCLCGAISKSEDDYLSLTPRERGDFLVSLTKCSGCAKEREARLKERLDKPPRRRFKKPA